MHSVSRELRFLRECAEAAGHEIVAEEIVRFAQLIPRLLER
jgi:hypothetical protein